MHVSATCSLVNGQAKVADADHMHLGLRRW